MKLTGRNKYIDDEDMIRAAKDACIHDVINSKPGAYDYMLAEDGSNLSGGQKQRILIARAIVGKPRVIFMDEATSALDNATQSRIVDTLEKLDATKIVIAHRLSTVMNCDRIIVMDRGRIKETGNYQELMEQKGLFYDLAVRQIS